MNQALRPMRLGEILDRTFHIYRERFWVLAASYDQRIRKKGFDIEWMMQSAGMAESLSAPGIASVPDEPVAEAAEEARA
ncbi:MAG TPA: hypothetical protein VGL22_10670 [Terracidiphilus sp.]|jgi:hypothetical protein